MPEFDLSLTSCKITIKIGLIEVNYYGEDSRCPALPDGYRLTLIDDFFKPVFLLSGPENYHMDLASFRYLHKSIYGTYMPGEPDCPYLVRCVELQRLPTILRTGCDVEPSNSVLWAIDSVWGALEYGGPEKVMMVFHTQHLRPTWLVVDAGIDYQKLQALQSTYSTCVRSIDGKKLWLSRLPEDDTRLASGYEEQCAFWIPGNSREALAMVFVIGQDHDKLQAMVDVAISLIGHDKSNL